MQFKSHNEIKAAAKKYNGQDKEDLLLIANSVKNQNWTEANMFVKNLDIIIRDECFEERLEDALNPKYLFSLTANDLLCKIVNGEIDPKELAWSELRNRGYDSNGKWVGFKDGACKKPF